MFNVQDSATLQSSCSFTVTVRDFEAPVISEAPVITGSEAATISSFTGADAVGHPA